MTDYRIHTITFDGDTVTIGYMASTDVRVEGMVGIAHQIQLSLEHEDYREDCLLLERQAVRTLRNALEDFDSSEPYDPSVELLDEDDDEAEMGSKPRPLRVDKPEFDGPF
ncbi:hypothetical protein GCM10028801_30390 [Nocardioides maradonensis]